MLLNVRPWCTKFMRSSATFVGVRALLPSCLVYQMGLAMWLLETVMPQIVSLSKRVQVAMLGMQTF